jgi:hypothetical protein
VKRLRPLLLAPAPIIVTTTTVYLAANGRRYLSRRSALRASARRWFFTKHPCDCEQPEFDPVGLGLTHDGFACLGHGMDPQRFARLVDRLVRRWTRADARRSTP